MAGAFRLIPVLEVKDDIVLLISGISPCGHVACTTRKGLLQLYSRTCLTTGQFHTLGDPGIHKLSLVNESVLVRCPSVVSLALVHSLKLIIVLHHSSRFLDLYSLPNLSHLKQSIPSHSNSIITMFTVYESPKSFRVAVVTDRGVEVHYQDLRQWKRIAPIYKRLLSIPERVVAISWIQGHLLCIGGVSGYSVIDIRSSEINIVCTVSDLHRPLISSSQASRWTVVATGSRSMAVFDHKESLKLNEYTTNDSIHSVIVVDESIIVLSSTHRIEVYSTYLSDGDECVRPTFCLSIPWGTPRTSSLTVVSNGAYLLCDSLVVYMNPVESVLHNTDCAIEEKLQELLNVETVSVVEINDLVSSWVYSILNNERHPFGACVKHYIEFIELCEVYTIARDITKDAFRELRRTLMYMFPVLNTRRVKLGSLIEISIEDSLLVLVSRHLRDLIQDHLSSELKNFTDQKRFLSEGRFGHSSSAIFGSSVDVTVEDIVYPLSIIQLFCTENNFSRCFDLLIELEIAVAGTVEKCMLFEQTGTLVNADELISILCFLLTYASPSIVTQTYLLFEICHPSRLRGRSGYYLTSLQLAISYISEYCNRRE